MAEPRFRIGTAARLAGLSTHAVRVWERRYGVPTPVRSQGGARLYSEAEVEQLRLLKRAVDRGHSISQLVQLERAELQRLAGGPDAVLSIDAFDEAPERVVEEFLAAVERFDAEYAEQLLERAAVVLSARTLVRDVLTPLLVRIGKAWADGSLCTASEHVASALVRDRAGLILRQLSREPGGELVVVATPEGELHELGAMLAATTAKLQGFGVLYLGPNLPSAQIALAARSASAELVALSIIALEPAPAAAQVSELAGELPSEIGVVVGGPNASEIATRAGPPVMALETLDGFEAFLRRRRQLAQK